MRQLDQVEKRLLRILAVQQQMSNTGAVDDFAKTLNNSANILKQMSETWKEIGRWVGQLTMVYLEPFLEKFLGFSIALREILKSINVMQGYQYGNLGKGGMFGAIEESAESAEESVQSLKTILLGFDKLNILGNTTTSGLMPDYSLLTNQIAKYESNLDEVRNNSNKIAENLLKWLGYHKEINTYVDEQGNEVENIVWQLNDGLTKIDLIKISLTSISAIISSLAISKLITNVSVMSKNISGLGTTLLEIAQNPVTQIALLVAGIALSVKETYNNSEAFRKSLDETIERLKEIGIDINFDYFLNPLKEIGEYLKNNIAPSISYGLLGALDLLTSITQLLTGDFKGALNSYGKVWEDMWKGFDSAFGTNLFKFFTETIPSFFKVTIPNAWNEFTSWLKSIPEWINKNVWQPVANFFISGFENIINFFIDSINKITSGMSKLWTWTGLDSIGQIENVVFNRVGATNTNVDTSNIVGTGSIGNTAENNMNLVQAILDSNSMLAKVIQETSQRSIELNGRKVSEAIYDDLRNVAIRKGNDITFAR